MSRRGLLMREEAGGRLRIAGRYAGIATPGADGTYRLVFNDRDRANRIELELGEEALDELEDIITELRIEQPRFDNSRRSVPLLMRKFMLDQFVFPDWPAREMVECYRREGGVLDHAEVLEWRTALSRPGAMSVLNAKLTLSVTRREMTDYLWLIVQTLADRAARDAAAWYARAGRDRVTRQIEQNLVGAYPHDGYDNAGALAQARRTALDAILPDAIVPLPKPPESAMTA